MKHSNISTLQKKPSTMKPPKEKEVLDMLYLEIPFKDHPKHSGFFKAGLNSFPFLAKRQNICCLHVSFFDLFLQKLHSLFC
jgi:hypothetical protein